MVVNNARDFNDVWEWDGSSWTERTPSGGAPAPRSFAGVAYDSARQRMVVTGGYTVTRSFLRDTWEWDGQSATWLLRDEGGLPALSGSAMTYHAASARTLLFGGYAPALAQYTDDTWHWDGQSWSKLEGLDPSPEPTAFVALGSDTARGKLLLFDGIEGSATWEWDGVRWTDRSLRARPTPRFYPNIAYDEARKRLIVHGGFGAGNVARGDTWEWDGSRWSSSTGGPDARGASGVAYDPIGGRTLLYGGFTATQTFADLWSWNGVSWTELPNPQPNPGRLAGMCAAFDRARSQLFVFASEDNDARTWTWNGASWVEHVLAEHPDARYNSACAYDATREQLVLFGGVHGNTVRGDTWIWNGASWSEFQGPGPEPRQSAALIYDARRKLLILFGGARGGSSLDDTWEWDGTGWREGITEAAARGRGQTGSAFDTEHGRVLLFGGQTSSVLNDLWELRTRAGACSSAAESPTGFCVDGVACESDSCGTCEACNTDRNPGRCTPVLGADDADSCGPAHGRTCDRAGLCRIALGQAATDPTQCASGFVVDGVCCETASCSACSTCRVEDKEIPDNPGRCGTQRSGLDLRDECAASAPSTCGPDGSCDARGSCKLHAAGTRCAEDLLGERLISSVCSGAGACQPVEAQCDGDHTLVAASGATVDCGAYACEGASCKTACSSIADCAIDKICAEDGSCRDAANTPEDDDGGCSWRITGAPHPLGQRAAWLLLGALSLLRRRSRPSGPSGAQSFA